MEAIDALVTFNVSTVPEYLRRSTLYRTLNSSDTDDIILPRIHMKPDCSVNSKEDFTHLLSTLQFWDTEDVPQELLQSVLLYDRFELQTILCSFEATFKSVVECRNILDIMLNEDVNLALRLGYLDMVKYLLVELNSTWDIEGAARYAVISGNLDALIYIHEQGALLDSTAACEASRRGYLNLLEYLLGHGVDYEHQFLYLAAEYGHIHVLTYLFAINPHRDFEVCRRAAEQGHLECLTLAVEQGCRLSGYIATQAAGGGRLEILRFVHEHGCELDTTPPTVLRIMAIWIV